MLLRVITISILCLSTLSACTNRYETVDAEASDDKNWVVVDVTNKEQLQDNEIAENNSLELSKSMSKSNVTLFSLEKPVAQIRSLKPDLQLINRNNKNVRVSKEGIPNFINEILSSNQNTQFDASFDTSSQAVTYKNRNADKTTGDIATIYFEHNSTQLSAGSLEAIQKIAHNFIPKSSIKLSVEGHSSVNAVIKESSLRKNVNLKVSMARAYAVANALVKSGVPANSIRTVGWGEEYPPKALNGRTLEDASRRVEIFTVNVQK